MASEKCGGGTCQKRVAVFCEVNLKKEVENFRHYIILLPASLFWYPRSNGDCFIDLACRELGNGKTRRQRSRLFFYDHRGGDASKKYWQILCKRFIYYCLTSWVSLYAVFIIFSSYKGDLDWETLVFTPNETWDVICSFLHVRKSERFFFIHAGKTNKIVLSTKIKMPFQ